VLQWAISQGCPSTKSTYTGAARAGHLAVVQWGREHAEGGVWDSYAITGTALHAPCYAILDWMATEGCLDRTQVSWHAARTQDGELWKWALAHGCPSTSFLTLRAAETDVSVLRWVRGKGCPWHSETSLGFASARFCRGSTHVWELPDMQWAIRAGCPWHPRTTLELIRSRRIVELKWAVRSGCPWHKAAILEFLRPPSTAACCRGHRSEGFGAWAMGAMRWALAHGCAWHEGVTVLAAKDADSRALRWVVTHGCPWHQETSLVIAEFSPLRRLQWAVANGCPWHAEASLAAARNPDPKVLRWALFNGCGWHVGTRRVLLGQREEGAAAGEAGAAVAAGRKVTVECEGTATHGVVSHAQRRRVITGCYTSADELPCP
jgi:hypothetical protein